MHGLKGNDGLAELHPLAGIFHRNVQCSLAQTHPQGTDTRSRHIKSFHSDDKTHAFPANESVCGDAAIVEKELPGGRGPETHLFFLLAEGKARISFLNNKRACSPGTFGPICHGDDCINLGLSSVGDPLLGSVENIMVTITLGSGLNAPCVTAGIGLCYPKCRQLFAAGDGREILLFLLFTTVKQYGIGPQATGRKSCGHANARPSHFFDCQAVLENPSPRTAVLFRQIDAKEVRLRQDLHNVPREFFALIEFSAYRANLLCGNLGCNLPDHLLFFGQEIIHSIPPLTNKAVNLSTYCSHELLPTHDYCPPAEPTAKSIKENQVSRLETAGAVGLVKGHWNSRG